LSNPFAFGASVKQFPVILHGSAFVLNLTSKIGYEFLCPDVVNAKSLNQIC
jgi:hypothetical protein